MKGATSFWEKENFGKLLMRVIFGLLFIAWGVRYFSGGISVLQTLGSIFNGIGITFWPGFWGSLSAVILILSGMCFMIGFFFRTNCALILGILLLKIFSIWFFAKDFFDVEFLLNTSLAVLFFSFLFIGAGRFSSDGH